MGTDMRAHLEYNQTGNYWVSLSSWDLIRDYDMYRLLANVRGDGALYPPRGVPCDAGDEACRAYLMPVAEDDEQLRLLRTRNLFAISRGEAEGYVASGASEWWPGRGRVDFVSNPEYRGASWLTAAEFRQVVDHYRATIPGLRAQEYDEYVAGMIERYGEDEGRRHAGANWQFPGEPHDFLHPEFRMLLAAMEAGEAAGFQLRLIFWFHG